MEKHKLYLYPLWLRIWHGINAICIILLMITGLSMQFGNIEYPLIPFKLAVNMHNVAGSLTVVSYAFFIVGNFLSDNGMHYRFRVKGFIDRFRKQINYYVKGYFKNEPKPFPITQESKFNPLQRGSYAFAMYVFMPITVITGIGLFFPDLIFDRMLFMSGVQFTAVTHSIFGFFISVFLLIHLYVASIGKKPLANYRSIVNGYHED